MQTEGILPHQAQGYIPPAWRHHLPPGDWRWTKTDEGILLTPGHGVCPLCHQKTAEWVFLGQWVGRCCMGDPLWLDPWFLAWVQWMGDHRHGFSPWQKGPDNLGSWSLHAVRAPAIVRDPWVDHWRRWRTLGYLHLNDTQRLKVWVSEWEGLGRRATTQGRMLRLADSAWTQAERYISIGASAPAPADHPIATCWEQLRTLSP